MHEEFQRAQQTWFQQKNNLMKSKYPKAPKNVVCKQCKGRFPNPILNGSNIVATCCASCNTAFAPKALKKSATDQQRAASGAFPHRFLGEIA